MDVLGRPLWRLTGPDRPTPWPGPTGACVSSPPGSWPGPGRSRAQRPAAGSPPRCRARSPARCAAVGAAEPPSDGSTARTGGSGAGSPVPDATGRPRRLVPRVRGAGHAGRCVAERRAPGALRVDVHAAPASPCRLGRRQRAVHPVRRARRRCSDQRRPRPRWKTNGVISQNLRWIRTTLLGRQPGWTVIPAPVGPWRPVRLRPGGPLEIVVAPGARPPVQRRPGRDDARER